MKEEDNVGVECGGSTNMRGVISSVGYHELVKRVKSRIMKSLEQISEDERCCYKGGGRDNVLTPPLEHYLCVPELVRYSRINEILDVSSIVLGRVTGAFKKWVVFELIHVFSGKTRKVYDLEIKFRVMNHEFGAAFPPEESDFYRAIITRFEYEGKNQVINASIKSIPPDTLEGNEKLGKYDISELSDYLLSFKKILTEDTYLSELTCNSRFFNPAIIAPIEASLGLDQKIASSLPFTFIPNGPRTDCDPDDCAESLRRQQFSAYSNLLTKKATDCIRNGNNTDARKLLDKAIEIWPKNVDAIVAIGAVEANNDKLEDAIDYFEKALIMQPDHNNALNYIVETTVTLSKTYERKRKWAETLDCCTRILNMPNLKNVSHLYDQVKQTVAHAKEALCQNADINHHPSCTQISHPTQDTTYKQSTSEEFVHLKTSPTSHCCSIKSTITHPPPIHSPLTTSTAGHLLSPIKVGCSETLLSIPTTTISASPTVTSNYQHVQQQSQGNGPVKKPSSTTAHHSVLSSDVKLKHFTNEDLKLVNSILNRK